MCILIYIMIIRRTVRGDNAVSGGGVMTRSYSGGGANDDSIAEAEKIRELQEEAYKKGEEHASHKKEGLAGYLGHWNIASLEGVLVLGAIIFFFAVIFNLWFVQCGKSKGIGDKMNCLIQYIFTSMTNIFTSIMKGIGKFFLSIFHL